MLKHRACARALSPRSFLLLKYRLQPTPSPLCRLASWPLLGACSILHVSRRAILDLRAREARCFLCPQKSCAALSLSGCLSRSPAPAREKTGYVTIQLQCPSTQRLPRRTHRPRPFTIGKISPSQSMSPPDPPFLECQDWPWGCTR